MSDGGHCCGDTLSRLVMPGLDTARRVYPTCGTLITAEVVQARLPLHPRLWWPRNESKTWMAGSSLRSPGHDDVEAAGSSAANDSRPPLRGARNDSMMRPGVL